MLKNYLKIAWRNILKHKGYSFINIFGLTIGITVFIVIALYVQHELSFDQYHENSDRIFRVVRGENNDSETGYALTSPPIGTALSEEIPEIVKSARIIKSRNLLISFEEKHFVENQIFWADNDIFNIFTIPFVKGSKIEALKDPSNIVISEKVSEKYFGEENPIGKVLTLQEGEAYTVSGVFQNFPSNGHFTMDIIVPIKNYFQLTGNDETKWTSNYAYTYVLLSKGIALDAMESKLASFENNHFSQYFENGVPRTFYLQPITEIHLYSHRRQEIEANNDFSGVLIFLSSGILILLIASINYINLTTAKSAERMKEVGMRKVLGAKRRQLLNQFLGESMLMVIIATLFSFGLAIVILPIFNTLMKTDLDLNLVHNPQIIIGLVLLILTIGLLSGVLPSRIITNIRPIDILNKIGLSKSKLGGFDFRNVLVVFQFSISIVLIILTIIIYNQLDFIQKKDMGYEKEHIVTLKSFDTPIVGNIETIKSELEKNPNILSVATSYSLPHNIDSSTVPDWFCFSADDCGSVYYNEADYDFVDLFDIDIVEGRNFSKEYPSDQNGAFLVNETLANSGIWDQPIGQEIDHWNGAKGKIVGVFKNFHSQSLHSTIAPLYIYLNEKNFSYISIRIGKENTTSNIAYIENVFKKFSPNYPLQYSFFDEEFDQTYKLEQRQGKIFSYFSIIAIILSCLGLFGLATYVAEKRKKEIGIRKVNGATITQVLTLLNKDFLKWVGLSFIISVPVSWYAMEQWLTNFAYKTNISWWIFVLAGALTLVIAFLTVSWQSFRAATANPVNSLRTE